MLESRMSAAPSGLRTVCRHCACPTGLNVAGHAVGAREELIVCATSRDRRAMRFGSAIRQVPLLISPAVRISAGQN